MTMSTSYFVKRKMPTQKRRIAIPILNTIINDLLPNFPSISKPNKVDPKFTMPTIKVISSVVKKDVS